MRVLLTDADERAALPAARSLVAAGHQVYAAARTRRTPAGGLRGVRPRLTTASPLEDPRGYVAQLARLTQKLDVAMLLAVTDASVQAVLEHRDGLPPTVVLPLPALRSYEWGSDKLFTLDLASSVGFAVPETVVLAAPAAPVPLPDADFFPAVVKPHRSVVQVPGSGRRRKVGVAFVADRAACRAALDALPATAYPVMLQQHVAGPGEGLFLLRREGRVVAQFAHRHIRETPPAGGVTVSRESIAPAPDLVAASHGLLDLLDWQGVAMVESKRDRASGRLVFLELNGRLWGSLQLAIEAGVDFPVLLAEWAAGRPAHDPMPYRAGA